MENTYPFDSSQLKIIFDKYSHFIGEFRKRILFTLIIFVLTSFLGFIYYEKIIRFLVSLLSLNGVNIVFTSPFQFINLAISSGIASGIILTFPLIIIQVLLFLKPALRKKEYKVVVRAIPISLILFIIGFLFGSWIMKWQIEIFLETSTSLGIGNILDISRLLNTVILTSVFMGIGFQFPIVLFILMRIGIIKARTLSKYRIWIYFGSFIFAILLPADSIIADVLFALPLIILFEVSLLFKPPSP